MKAYRDKVRADAAAIGRDPDSIKVLFLAHPIIDVTMDAARERTPEGRSRLFGLLGQLFLARGEGLSESESRGFVELLEILRPFATVEARLELAYATANAPFAPGGLAKLLADDDIEIASLVLFQSESLGTMELMALAERDGVAGNGYV